MAKTGGFRSDIENGHMFKGDSLLMGTSMLDGQSVENNPVKIYL